MTGTAVRPTRNLQLPATRGLSLNPKFKSLMIWKNRSRRPLSAPSRLESLQAVTAPVCWPLSYRIRGDHPVLAREFSRVLSDCGFISRKDGDAWMTVILSPARRFESPPGEPILDWRGLAGRKNGQQLLFTYRAWSLEVDLTTRTLHCSGPDPDPAGCLGFRESFLLNAVLVVIHRYGFFELHAAAGAHHATGYLLLGPSGSGKTTALVSLVTSGWNYLTDDAVVVSQSPGGGISAHPLRRSFSFKPDLLDRYPELATYATDHVIETDKRRLDPRELWPRQAVSMISPKFIVACGLADEKKSSISPISRAESP